MATTEEVQTLIAEVCDSLKELLLTKNRKYGNSAIEPARIFSRCDPLEQIKVRIDDKLNRIRTTGLRAGDEDTTHDLIGYLVLMLVAEKVQAVEAVKPKSEWKGETYSSSGYPGRSVSYPKK